MRLGIGYAVNFYKNFSINRHRSRKTLTFSNMDYLQHLYSRILGYGTAEYTTNSTENDALPRKVVAFGNVLLDHTAHLNDTGLLERYQLKLNTRGELDVDTLLKVTADVTVPNDQPDHHLGGSALNTVRILKRLGIEPMFFGAVGDDKFSNVVEDLLKKEGMETNNYRLQKIDKTPTGRCICLVHRDELALYANVGASSQFSETYLKEIECNEKAFFLRSSGNKQIFYIEGFFVPQREQVITYVVRNYIQGRRRLAVNLSADYIVKTNYNHMAYLAHHAFFLFGNKTEFETFQECWGASSIESLAEELIKQSKGVKIIVITRGADGVTLVTNYQDELSPPGNVTFESFNVPKINNLVDTTGCGDAFVAGFLHAWLEKRSLSECVRLASDIAAKVATQVGCQLP